MISASHVGFYGYGEADAVVTMFVYVPGKD